jgi:hypothetical protein
MTWWEWALLLVWGPGIALVIALSAMIGVLLAVGRFRDPRRERAGFRTHEIEPHS